MKKIRKAIIPAAGLGTRFLPATKTVPKEMLTIVDSPIIFYVIEEAVRAGIEDIILIQGRGKTAIEDFFDVSYELEDKLLKDGKTDTLERLVRIRDMANLISIRQKKPLGLGHAVLCGDAALNGEDFAVLLGDEIMVQKQVDQKMTTECLTKIFQETGEGVLAVMKVEEKEKSKYGIAELLPLVQRKLGGEVLYQVERLIEKPEPGETDSLWALPGRYVFNYSIIEELKNTKSGKNGEIQLTDAMSALNKKNRFLAFENNCSRYDAGDRLGFLKANVELGLKNPEFGEDFLIYLKSRLAREFQEGV